MKEDKKKEEDNKLEQNMESGLKPEREIYVTKYEKLSGPIITDIINIGIIDTFLPSQPDILIITRKIEYYE